jgi:hypothetical protein
VVIVLAHSHSSLRTEMMIVDDNSPLLDWNKTTSKPGTN